MRVSIILEGDNEKHCPVDTESAGEVARCLGLEGLLQQDFPLNEAELILVGTADQTRRWAEQAKPGGFAAIHQVAIPGEDYFEMKLAGKQVASAPLLAIVDSDVFPQRKWLSALVGNLEQGHDISAGLTRLHWHGLAKPESPLMLCQGAISWGAILREDGSASGFHANNVGLRASLFDGLVTAKGLFRACAAHHLMDRWRNEGKRIAFSSDQCVVHAFSLDWWFHMHARTGIEAMLLRRMLPDWPHQWVAKLGWLEPLPTCAWRFVHDTPQWWRYAQACGVGPLARIITWPLFLLVSALTRGVGIWGAYSVLLSGNWKREVATHLAVQD